MKIGKIEYRASSLVLSGAWTTPELAKIESTFAALDLPPSGALGVDAAEIAAMDTGGAWLLHRILETLRQRGLSMRIQGLGEHYQGLLRLVDQRLGEAQPEPATAAPGLLEVLGRRVALYGEEALALLAFIGQAFLALLRSVKDPSRIRWGALAGNVEHAGLRAIPIVSLLSFLLGVVIAYQGGIQLRNYGANIFIVELVSLTMLRELAPMMTAIIVAGRTGSAYTAEIGTMKVNEEIDALHTIGIAPMDILVLPKVLGLLVAVPLLTLVADAMGVLGGMVMSAAMLGVGFQDFVDRLPQVISPRSLLIGIGKAPVFAGIVALVGCVQGFRVSGGADSVGRQTTVSVVQAIFLVIVADAAFSIVFGWLGI